MGFIRVSASHEEAEGFGLWESASDEKSGSVAASAFEGSRQQKGVSVHLWGRTWLPASLQLPWIGPGRFVA